MLFKLFSGILGLTSVMAGVGPQALYQLLNGQTFNPPGYTIVMYRSCMQNQNAGNPCGSFTTFETSNGVYTYQRYGPEAPVSSTCSRTFLLSLACGATMSMSGVNENPTCVYSATLTLPQACGIDMTVGNEAASVSGTAVPATPSSSIAQSGTFSPSSSSIQTQSSTYSYTGTITSSGTSTSSPLFEIIPYPSKDPTPSIPVTTTPLFMVTAWPTVSPVNVSVPPAASSSSPTSSTGVILGAVAVGLVGLLIVGFAVNHFRKGGTVAGFMKEVESKKEELKKVASMLPLSEEHKATLDKALKDPSSLLPVEAQKMLESVKEVKNKVVSALPISEEQKAQINTVIESLPQKLVEKVSSPKVEPEPKPEPESLAEVEKEIPQREVSIVIDPAHIEAVKQFLASKNAEVKTD